MKRIIEMIRYPFGIAATGIHISQVKSTVKTCYPDIRVPANQWHDVIYSELKKVQDRLKEH